MRVRTDEAVAAHCGAILLFLWIIAVLCGVRVVVASALRTAPVDVCEGVDPNVAPWWDLTLLPEVGPATALAIVELRDDKPRPAYHAAIDLTRVKGIGPRTIERFGRYLRLDSRMQNSETPVDASGGPGQ